MSPRFRPRAFYIGGRAMQASYNGYFRMPWWGWIGFPLLVWGAGFITWSLIQDDLYAENLRTAPHDRYGFVIEAVPRPILILLFGVVTLAFAAVTIFQILATLQRRQSFRVDASGVRSYYLFTGRERHLTWPQVTSMWKYKSTLVFKGKDMTGRTRRVNIVLIGHSYKQVKAVVAVYRSDLV